jgi:hypothetical protein
MQQQLAAPHIVDRSPWLHPACVGGVSHAAPHRRWPCKTSAASLLLLLLLLLAQEADLVLEEYTLNGCRGDGGQAMCSSITMPRVRNRSWCKLPHNNSSAATICSAAEH